MLKHCSPSAVDLSKRSSISRIREHDDNEDLQGPLASSSSSSTSSSSGSSSSSSSSSTSGSDSFSLQSSGSIHSQHHGSTQTDLVISQFKDAATSPLFRARRIIPLASIIKHRQQQLVHDHTEYDPGHFHPGSSLPSFSHHPTGSSLNANARIPIKVYAKCLRSDIEYKTLSLSPQTTAKELIWVLLSKYKMRHRDPKLFYLTMDINIKRTGIPLQRSLSLDDESRPVELKSCHPWGECKFTLQMRKGGVVRIYDSVLMAESKYKCLLISETTTVREVVQILFHCYGLDANGDQKRSSDRYCIFEQNPARSFERRLNSDERPILVQSLWPNPSNCMFVLRLTHSSSSSSLSEMVVEEAETMVDAPDDHEREGEEEGDGVEESPLSKRVTSSRSPESRNTKIPGREDLDTSYGSSGESTASSEFSALRFHDSPALSSTRSDESSGGDSGLLKSSPDFVPHYQKRTSNPSGATSTTANHCQQLKPNTFKMVSRQISLHSLLETLPAASVDTGVLDSKSRKTSLSSLSLDSRSSDFDSYFYI